MSRSLQSIKSHLCAAALLAGLASGVAAGQTRPTSVPTSPSAQPVSTPTEPDLSATQEQLIKLLRLSPTLTTVVEHDPSLLSNQDYVERNNPQLGEFLRSHPEISRNPDFYLFTRLQGDGEGPDRALDRAVWPQFAQPRRSALEDISNNLIPFLVFVCAMATLIWLTRIFIENRRWSRIFKLQMDVHGKLIEKFNSNEDLLVYMGTEAGKRFLEAAPIPVSLESDQRMPNAVARVLNPLQIGIVLTLLGAGLLFLRHADYEMRLPMMVLGTIVLMPGIGFILSSAVTWLLAGRLGLMPPQFPVRDMRYETRLPGAYEKNDGEANFRP